MTRTSSRSIVAMSTKELRAHLAEPGHNLGYGTLLRYRKALVLAHEAAAGDAANAPSDPTLAKSERAASKKAKMVDSMLRERVAAGVTVRRRKPGSGTKTEVQLVYQDTPGNRKLGRVGQSYTKVVYKDAEVEDVQRRLRRRKRAASAGTRQGNSWIRAVMQAKAELGAPGFLIIRKQAPEPLADGAVDPIAELGARVYARAKEIMAAAAAVTPAVDAPPAGAPSSEVAGAAEVQTAA